MAKYETAINQNAAEHAWFIDILKSEGVQRYLEIGSKFGGSLWRVANALPPGSRIVSVDLPWGDGSFKDSQPHLEECIGALRRRGYDAHLIIGDSTDAETIRRAAALAPFDACFIDGGHMLATVTSDWHNYGVLARIVAFHDIAWIPRASKKQIEVPQFWNALKSGFRHSEKKLEPRDNGIGVLWRD